MMFARVHHALSGLSRMGVILAALAALAAVGAVDHVTGGELSSSVFYVLPVGIAAWYADRAAGFVFSLASSGMGYLIDVVAGNPFHHPLIPVWNACVRLAFFVIIAILLSALRDRLAAEQRLARTDPLTGLLNRRTFADQLEHDLRLSDRVRSPLALAYVDLDDFKQVNDTYGHREGDRALVAVAERLIDATRRADTVARLGGDEFALILPGTDVAGARAVLAKVRQLLGELSRQAGRSLTCSVGVVVFRQQPATIEDAVALADRAMYEAKAQGKDGAVVRVYAAGEPGNAAMPEGIR